MSNADYFSDFSPDDIRKASSFMIAMALDKERGADRLRLEARLLRRLAIEADAIRAGMAGSRQGPNAGAGRPSPDRAGDGEAQPARPSTPRPGDPPPTS